MKYLEAVAFTLAAAGGALFLFFYPSPKGAFYYLSGTIAALAIIIVYLALGLKILKLLKIEAPDELAWPYAFALASGFFGTAVFAAGFLKLYNYWYAYAFFCAAAVVSAAEIKKIFGGIRSAVKGAAEMKTGASGLAFAALGSGMLFYMFITSLLPPVYYDSLVYHLGVPGQYIAAGGIINLKENIFSYFPQLMQMNHLLVLLLTNELAVKLFQLFTGLTALMAVWGIAERTGADKKAAVLLVITCPLFFLNTTRVGAELPLALFTVLLLSLIVEACESGAKNSLLVLAGIFGGLIISVKYTGVIVYACGALVFIFLMMKKRARLSGLLAYIIIPALIVLPYLLKNYLFTGNPVYPFLCGVFNTEEGLAGDAAGYVGHVAGFGLAHNLRNFIISPFIAAARADVFGGDVISPLFIISFLAVPLAGLKKTWLLASFIAVYFTAWFFTGQVLRFLLPLVPAAALLFAAAYKSSGSKFKNAALLLIVVPQALVSVYYAEKYLSPFSVFTRDRKEYAAERVSYYAAAEFLNKNTDRKTAVLFLGEARSFYMKKQALAYTVFNHREALDGFGGMEESKIIAGLELRNIGYVLVNYSELLRLKDSGYADVYALVESAKFKNIMDKYFKKIYSDGKCAVYELTGRQ